MIFKGAAKPLADGDIPRIARTIGVGEDELHAFMDAETSGKGFDRHGRPKMLFEPHIFYRLLGKGDKRAKAVRAGLAYENWRPGKYPPDSYPRLLKAMEIDEDAALKSASWGLGQIMGSNYKLAGYPSPRAMVDAFMEDEAAHLRAIVAFLKGAKLATALKQHDWRTVARGYNGPGYEKNAYHTKLAQRFAWWQKRKDTVIADSAPDDLTQPIVEIEGKQPKLPPYEIEAIQKKLRELGYFTVGKVDGKWGPRTAAAIFDFQMNEKITADGIYGPETKERMAKAEKRPVSRERAETTVDDLRKQGSTTIAQADSAEMKTGFLGLGGLVAAIGSTIMNYAGDAVAYIKPIKDVFDDIPGWAWGLGVALVCFALYRNTQGVKQARLLAEQTGMHNGEPDPSPSPPVKFAPDIPGAG